MYLIQHKTKSRLNINKNKPTEGVSSGQMVDHGDFCHTAAAGLFSSEKVRIQYRNVSPGAGKGVHGGWGMAGIMGFQNQLRHAPKMWLFNNWKL